MSGCPAENPSYSLAMRFRTLLVAPLVLVTSSCGGDDLSKADYESACVTHFDGDHPQVIGSIDSIRVDEPDSDIVTVTLALEGTVRGSAACDITSDTGEVVTSRLAIKDARGR